MARYYYYARPDFEAEPGPVLDSIIAKLRHGDFLIVPNVSHIALTFCDLKNLVVKITSKGAILQPEHVSGRRDEHLHARYKRDLKLSAVARAKARGAYANCKGRAPSIDRDAIRKLKESGLTADEIAKQVGCARSSVYYVLRPPA